MYPFSDLQPPAVVVNSAGQEVFLASLLEHAAACLRQFVDVVDGIPCNATDDPTFAALSSWQQEQGPRFWRSFCA